VKADPGGVDSIVIVDTFERQARMMRVRIPLGKGRSCAFLNVGGKALEPPPEITRRAGFHSGRFEGS